MAKYILKKDIIIPSGTVFTIAPTDTVRVGDGHIQHTFGLTRDTSGSVEYCIQDMTEDEIGEWFEKENTQWNVHIKFVVP